MSDDDIRDLLASLPHEEAIPRPPGSVAVLRARVEDAGADLEAVDAWVARHGGRQGRTKPAQVRSRRAGRMTTDPVAAQAYYLVRSADLRAPRADATG
jgi:hypothetical protein